MKVNAKNIGLSMAYGQADMIVVPTPFQASGFPPAFRPHMRIVHEGVDMSRAARKPNPRLRMPNGKVLDGSTPVITFINRNMERLRGFHIFMRALPAFMERRPDAHVVLIGSDSPGGYGGKLEGGETWAGKMLKEVGNRLDPKRIHFTGPLSHGDMITALSMSWGHVYYTYPFVLSWSLVEAMACECLIIGSDTGPVRDAITSGVNGVLNDFFDVGALTEAMVEACEHPERFTEMRKAARVTARANYDRETVGVPAWMALIDEVLARPRAS
jgi:glycosyltransferase involved in cell wall biosynthesis